MQIIMLILLLNFQDLLMFQKNDLNTQVAILESSSVLEPTFQFVASSKQKKGIDFVKAF